MGPTYEDKKYMATKETLEATLIKYGVAVIESVFDQDECDQLLSEMWDFFEEITEGWDTPISRSNRDTWKHFYDLYPKHSMLIQHHGVGNAAFAWTARQNEKAVSIFAYLYKCRKEDLLVSFDGSSFHLPPEDTGKGFARKEFPGYHTDQSYTRNKFECVQSFVTLRDINEKDGTLAFLEGSHNSHAFFAKKFNKTSKEDWHMLDDKEREFYLYWGHEERRIVCKRGSMVFWDSRTIHCGVEPLSSRVTPNLRAVIYLCYQPRSKIASPKILEKRINAFVDKRTTSHWPLKPKLFAKKPRLYPRQVMKAVKPAKNAIITPLGRRLIGYEK